MQHVFGAVFKIHSLRILRKAALLPSGENAPSYESELKSTLFIHLFQIFGSLAKCQCIFKCLRPFQKLMRSKSFLKRRRIMM